MHKKAYRNHTETALWKFLKDLYLLLLGFGKSFNSLSHSKSIIRIRKVKKRGRPKIKKETHFAFKLTSFLYGALAVSLFVLLPLTLLSWYRDLPNPVLLKERELGCTKIMDRKERLLYEVCPEVRSEPVALNGVSQHLVNATLAVEDSNFYKHNGFQPASIVRAAYQTFLKDNTQGGSTITQQLVKLSLLSPERTYSRKMKELFLAVLVEKMYSKEEILEMYLNSSPYGGNIVGVETAARRFFNKSSKDLSIAESSMLAGLPTAPSVFSPFVSMEAAKNRQRTVLGRMADSGFISEEEAERIYNEPLEFAEQRDFIRAPHFVEFVRAELENNFGRHLVTFGSLTVVTTLDLDVQDSAQSIISEQVEKSQAYRISNGAAVVLEAKTGEILAMVGSRSYFDEQIDGKFNVVTAMRQPGSSIKPVTYALALSKGFTAGSLVDDNPVSIADGAGFYKPVNYDGRFHGKVTIRQALANSYNVAAVNVLRALDIDEMVMLGKNMGLKTWKPDGAYGLSITLGGKETRLLDLANVYGTLARGGVYTDTKSLLSVKDKKGYELFKPGRTGKRILNEEIAFIITDILADSRARLPAFGTNNFLSVKGHTVAVKTGTTDQKRDNYTVGYTPSYVVGVWVGNNDNSPMNPNLASGLTGAAPAWNKIMAYLLSGKENEVFNRPSRIVTSIRDCSKGREIYLKGTEPKIFDCEKQGMVQEPDEE